MPNVTPATGVGLSRRMCFFMFLFVFSASLLGFGISIWRGSLPHRDGIITTGTITGTTASTSNRSENPQKTPQVTFITNDGETFVCNDCYGVSWHPKKQVGRRVRVSYLPSDPSSSARNLDNGSKLLAGILLGLFGAIVACVVGVVAVYVHLRRSASHSVLIPPAAQMSAVDTTAAPAVTHQHVGGQLVQGVQLIRPPRRPKVWHSITT